MLIPVGHGLIFDAFVFSFMSDQEAWHELSNLYMSVGDYTKAAFCMEEVLLHNPHSHLIHQRLGEIRYTMVSRPWNKRQIDFN